MKSFFRNDFASVPGEETITAIPDHSVPIGQTDKMSKIDIERINKLYKCSEYKRHGRDNPLFPKMYNEMYLSFLMYFFIDSMEDISTETGVGDVISECQIILMTHFLSFFSDI